MISNNFIVKEVKLEAIQVGNYTVYVFKSNDEYIMCTKLPNWQTSEINIGDIGFLKYQIVEAGEEYLNLETNQITKYKYSNIYFLDFVKKTDNIKNDIIQL